MDDRARIDEHARIDAEAQAAAHDRPATLVLVAGEVHAGAVERGERALDAVAPDPGGDVGFGRARVREEPGVRRAREAKRPSDAREQPFVATRIAVADDRPHRVERERRAQEARQRGEEAQPDAKVVAAQRKRQPRHGSATSARLTDAASNVASHASRSPAP